MPRPFSEDFLPELHRTAGALHFSPFLYPLRYCHHDDHDHHAIITMTSCGRLDHAGRLLGTHHTASDTTSSSPSTCWLGLRLRTSTLLGAVLSTVLRSVLRPAAGCGGRRSEASSHVVRVLEGKQLELEGGRRLFGSVVSVEEPNVSVVRLSFRKEKDI